MSKRLYRKVGPTESDRGELYPCWTSGIPLLAHFGLGVGVYYMQLIIQAGIFIIAGLVLIPVMLSFGSKSYGDNSYDTRLYASGACSASVKVNATVGCDPGEDICSSMFRESCELPQNAIVADLAMSLLVLVLLFAAKVPEKELLEQLDEAVQTLQDYSLDVRNPPEDADNPDEWFEFFSRFGNVRLITVCRANGDLCNLLLDKHLLLRKDAHLNEQKNSFISADFLGARERRVAELKGLDTKLEAAFRMHYGVSRVYVTYDTEFYQRHCLEELSARDNIFSKCFKADHNIAKRLKFRDSIVLDVGESQEFDNIHWQNIEISDSKKKAYRWISLLVTGLVLSSIYFFIEWVHNTYLTQLPIAIAFADMLLPMIFDLISDLERPTDEDDKQDSLLVKLLGARLLITIVFPYYFTPWSSFLDDSNVISLVNTQLAG